MAYNKCLGTSCDRVSGDASKPCSNVIAAELWGTERYADAELHQNIPWTGVLQRLSSFRLDLRRFQWKNTCFRGACVFWRRGWTRVFSFPTYRCQTGGREERRQMNELKGGKSDL